MASAADVDEQYRQGLYQRETGQPYTAIDTLDSVLAANPGLKDDMFVIKCGGSGNRLEEVRVCFDRAGQFRACGKNEDQRKSCAAPRMYVPPVR